MLSINRGLAPPYPIYFEGRLYNIRVYLCWNLSHIRALHYHETASYHL